MRGAGKFAGIPAPKNEAFICWKLDLVPWEVLGKTLWGRFIKEEV
jgi:hypothetical protein